jgi:putative nucleotidyltransferase with HDIG domain
MASRTEIRLHAETIALKIRTFLVLFVALVLFMAFGPLVAAGGLLVGAVLSAIGFYGLRGGARYHRFGRMYLGNLRVFDALVLSASGTSTVLEYDHLWLLAVPVIIGEALVGRSRARVVGVAMATSFVGCAGLITAHKPMGLALVLLGVYAAAAWLAVVLGERQSKDEQLLQRDRRLAAVTQVCAHLSRPDSLSEKARTVMEAAVRETGAMQGAVWIIDEDGELELVCESGRGLVGSTLRHVALRVVDTRSPWVVRPAVRADALVLAGVGAVAAFPLLAGASSSGPGELVGVSIFAFDHEPNALDDDEIDLLATLSSLLALTSLNERMREREAAAYLSTLHSLAAALEARDVYTRGHSQRVSDLSVLLAERMGVPDADLEALRVGTLLHDIGKIGVPDSILNKPGRLTDEELEAMKRHPVIGFEICRQLRLPDLALRIIRHHHERLDGRGYPDGLPASELSLPIRIVIAVDAFDAMVSRRSYREAAPIEDALAEMERHVGSQFDPEIVAALRRLVTSDSIDDVVPSAA